MFLIGFGSFFPALGFRGSVLRTPALISPRKAHLTVRSNSAYMCSTISFVDTFKHYIIIHLSLFLTVWLDFIVARLLLWELASSGKQQTWLPRNTDPCRVPGFSFLITHLYTGQSMEGRKLSHQNGSWGY